MIDLYGLRLLVVSASPHRGVSLRDVLERAGLDVTVTHTPAEALDALAALPQDVLLIDGRFGEPFPDAFPRIRLHHAGTPPRHVLLIDPPQGPALTHWMRVLGDHGLTPQVLASDNPFRVIESMIEALAPAPAPPAPPLAEAALHPPGLQPQPEALVLVAGLWARRASGRLELPLLQREARLVGGEPAGPAELGVVVQALYVGSVTFHAEAVDGAPRPRLAAELWEAAQRLSRPEQVMESLGHLLVQRSAGRRAAELPLPPEVRALLAAHDPRTSLLGMCAAARLAPSAVAAPLGTLVALGMFSLRPAPWSAPPEAPSEAPGLTPPPRAAEAPPRAAEAPPRAPQAPPRAPQAPPRAPQAPPRAAEAPPRAPQAPPRPRDPGLLKRLRREWELIELADPWTTLGIPKDSPPDLIARAVDRLERRYAALDTPDEEDAELRALARQILVRVRAAGEAVREGGAATPALPPPDVAFRHGRQALEMGDFSRAARWFQAARQAEPRSAAFNGYLGWAMYHDTSLPQAQRRKKGRDLLQLAEVTAEPSPDIQLFLARIEHAEGEVGQARARLKAMLRLWPDDRQARRLLESLPPEDP